MQLESLCEFRALEPKSLKFDFSAGTASVIFIYLAYLKAKKQTKQSPKMPNWCLWCFGFQTLWLWMTRLHASTSSDDVFWNFHHLNRTLTLQFGLSGGQSKSSWWFQPMWKIWSSNWKSSPNWGENKKCLKPPPRSLVISQENIEWPKMLFQLWLQLLWSMACHPPDTIIIVKSQT